MVKRTPKLVAPEISLLLPELEARGFEKIKPRDVEEALEMMDYTYDVSGNQFYFSEPMNNPNVPGSAVLRPIEQNRVLDEVASYLLSSSFDETGVIDGARFLPDPSGPTTDLEELAKEQARVEGQRIERLERRNSIYNQSVGGEANLTATPEQLGNYLSLLEQHMPELALPGKEDAAQRQAYTEKFFTEVVAVRGPNSLDQYLIDLERIASQGVAEVTAALVQSAPTLYHKLSVEGAGKFVTDGLEELQRYKTIPLHPVLGNVVEYFSLSSDAAKQTITDLMIMEQEQLLPAYAAMKKELGRVEKTAESMRKALEEKIRVNSDLEQKYNVDAAALEQEREKTAQLKESVQGLTLGYQTAASSRDAVRKLLDENKKEFDSYKSEAAIELGQSKVTAFIGWTLAATLAVATYVGFTRTPSSTSALSKPVPAVTVPSVPATPSYDPQGKNVKQLEQDLTTYIKQQRSAGKGLIVGPGCHNVLEQLYTRMGGIASGKGYFLDTMALSNFCNGIPADKKIKY